MDRPHEQLIQYPLSLSDTDGNPLTGKKSYFTKYVETRYQKSDPPIITQSLPTGWKPKCSLLEGMFIINTTPLLHHKTLGDYGAFLLKRFVLPQFRNGTQEVHVIFDNLEKNQMTPKYFERKRRDTVSTVAASHKCLSLEEESEQIIHKGWRENVLNCRYCKRKLVCFVGQYFLHNSSYHLRENQSIYVAGAFSGDISDTAWFVTSQSVPQPEPAYCSDAEETDTRIWLHARKTRYNRVLIVSPDTDVYMIGLALPSATAKDIIVQVSTYNARELKYLHLSNLIKALQCDPDLGQLRMSDLPSILQCLYVCTGCDFVSFFSEIGKASFMKTFFQHATFITGETYPSTPGTLAFQMPISNWKHGFLAFLRLVGTVYFKRHSSGFGSQSPSTHYHSFSHLGLSAEEQHYMWLEDIRETMWFRTQFENQMMASNESLKRHWMRSCWVMHLWRQADMNNMTLKPMTDYGWAIVNGNLTVQWDTEENLKAIQDRMMILTKGCTCATGCNTKRCGCFKKGKSCSVGCNCKNCCNAAQLHTDTSTDPTISGPLASQNLSALADLCIEEERDTIELDEIEDIMDFVFEAGEDPNEEENWTDESSDCEEDSLPGDPLGDQDLEEFDEHA